MSIRIREDFPVYSNFFRTEHDEQRDTGALEAHYSILSVPSVNKDDGVLDIQRIAVIWDADHDERVIPILEAACFKGLLRDVLFIAEHKGAVSIILNGNTKPFSQNLQKRKWQGICDDVIEGDAFSIDLMSVDDYIQTLDNSLQSMYKNYFTYIDDVWNLGPQPYAPIKPRQRRKRIW